MNAKVIVADDETSIRQMTVFVLNAMNTPKENYEVIAEAADGEELLRLCRKLKPHFIIADLRLPKLDAVSVILRLRAEKLPIPMMIYTGCDDRRQLVAALDAKPEVVVHKADEIDDLRTGLRCAAQGRSYFSTRPTAALAAVRMGGGEVKLKNSEMELLKLLASSHSNKQAADILHISPSTVDNRRTELMDKLNLHDIAALTRKAVALGLVDAGR